MKLTNEIILYLLAYLILITTKDIIKKHNAVLDDIKCEHISKSCPTSTLKILDKIAVRLMKNAIIDKKTRAIWYCTNANNNAVLINIKHIAVEIFIENGEEFNNGKKVKWKR